MHDHSWDVYLTSACGGFCGLLWDNRFMTDESPIHTVHKRVCHTLLRHWKAHNNAYLPVFGQGG